MATIRTTRGQPGSNLAIVTKFYHNGALFNPYAIVNVGIYDAEVGGNLIAAPTVTNTSTGVYQIVWSIGSGQAPGQYFDRWVWEAINGMGNQTSTYCTIVNGNYVGEQTPSTLTGPLFVTSKERNFFNHIGKELIQRVVSQRITYYSVSIEHTKTHSLYEEALKKTTFEPVEINALVLYKPPTQTNNSFSIDTVYEIDVYLQRHELRERNIDPKVGDFIRFGRVIYEILSATLPQLTFGQIQEEVMVKLEARVSRKSNFETVGDE